MLRPDILMFTCSLPLYLLLAFMILLVVVGNETFTKIDADAGTVVYLKRWYLFSNPDLCIMELKHLRELYILEERNSHISPAFRRFLSDEINVIRRHTPSDLEIITEYGQYGLHSFIFGRAIYRIYDQFIEFLKSLYRVEKTHENSRKDIVISCVVLEPLLDQPFPLRDSVLNEIKLETGSRGIIDAVARRWKALKFDGFTGPGEWPAVDAADALLRFAVDATRFYDCFAVAHRTPSPPRALRKQYRFLAARLTALAFLSEEKKTSHAKIEREIGRIDEWIGKQLARVDR